MKIVKRIVIEPGNEEGDKPDAVKIEIAGVTALVNLHTGVVNIDGADHADPTEGENNTLEIHACPQVPEGAGGLVDLLDLLRIFPGPRVKFMNVHNLEDLLQQERH